MAVTSACSFASQFGAARSSVHCHRIKNRLQPPAREALDLLTETEEWLTDSRGFSYTCRDCYPVAGLCDMSE